MCVCVRTRSNSHRICTGSGGGGHSICRRKQQQDATDFEDVLTFRRRGCVKARWLYSGRLKVHGARSTVFVRDKTFMLY